MKPKFVISILLTIVLLLGSVSMVMAVFTSINVNNGVIDTLPTFPTGWGSIPKATDAIGDAPAGQDIYKAWASVNAASPTEIAFRVQMHGSLDSANYGLIGQISCDGDAIYDENGVDLWIWLNASSSSAVIADDPDPTYSMSYNGDDRWDAIGSPPTDLEWKVDQTYVDDYIYSGKWASCVAASPTWKINVVSMYLWSLSGPSDQVQFDLYLPAVYHFIDTSNGDIDVRPTYPSGWSSGPNGLDAIGDAPVGQDIYKAWAATNAASPTQIAFRVLMDSPLDSANYGLIGQISCDGDDIFDETGVDLWIWLNASSSSAVIADDPDPTHSMSYNGDDRWDIIWTLKDMEWKVDQTYVDDYTYSGKWAECVAASPTWKINVVSMYLWALSGPSDQVQFSLASPTVVDTTAFEAHSVQTPYLWGLVSLALLGLSLFIVRRLRRS